MAKMKQKMKSGGSGMLAPESQIVIKQGKSAKSRYTSDLAPASEVMIKQTKDYKDGRY